MPRAFPATCLACLVLLPAGCGSFPEVDAAARDRNLGRAALPVITPVDAIRDQATTLTITDADTAIIDERAMTLRSRAAGLEAPVGDPATVARLMASMPEP